MAIRIGNNGDNILDGTDGTDLLIARGGDDVINAGAGSDIVLAGNGNDTVIHVASENSNSIDTYFGGQGADTLRLVVTQEMFDSAAFQADLARFDARIDRYGSASGYFVSLNILFSSFEHIEVVIEGGGNQAPTITTTDPDAVSEGDAGAPDSVTVTIADHVAISDPDAGDAQTPYAGALMLQSVSGPAPAGGLEALFTLDAANGTVSYDRAAFDYLAFDETVTATFTFDASSGPDTVSQTITLTITGENDAPVATGESATTDEDIPVTIAVLGSDTDADASDILFVSEASAANGSVVIEADGRLTYTPNTNFNGADTISYTVSDGHGGTDTATVAVTVNSVNDAPDSISLGHIIQEDTAYTFGAADFTFEDAADSPPNALLAVKITTLPGQGLLTLDGAPVAAGDVVSIDDITAGNLVFTPAANSTSSISFTYQVQDDGGTANGGVDLDPAPDQQFFSINAVDDAPAGVPAIVGAAVEDSELSVDLSGITDVDGTLMATAYQWFAGGAAIAGATAVTFTPGDAEVGAAISVKVTVVDAQGGSGVVASAPTDPVANVDDAPAGVPVIAGAAVEDSELSVDLSGVSDADGALMATAYQWFASGAAIAGATAATFTPGDAEVGAAISVKVTVVDAQGGSGVVASAPTDPVANVDDAPAGVPVIAGAAVEDSQLSVDLSGVTDADGTLTATAYQWFASGAAIAGATAATFTPGDAEVGAAISVEVTVQDPLGGIAAVTSAATDPVANVDDAPAGVPAIVGAPIEDSELSVDLSGVSDVDGTLMATAYQWFAGGAAIAGATAATFTPGDAEVGAAISVEVTVVDAQGGSGVVASAPTDPVANVDDAPAGVPAIVGAAVEDSELSVDLSGITDADGTLMATAYQWFAGGAAIAGATAATFTPGDAEVGAAISVEVTVQDPQGGSGVVTSAPTDPVANVDDAPAGVPAIVGAAVEDSELSVDLSGVTDVDGALTATAYQWFAGGAAIAGATAATFTPGDAEVGAAISVKVTVLDPQGGSGVVASAPTDPVANVDDAPAGAPAIVGTPIEDSELSVDLSGVTDVDGALMAAAYQWFAGGVAIAGATAATFTPGDAEVGAAISVEVTVLDPQGGSGVVASAPTDPVANVDDAPAGVPVIVGAAVEDSELSVDLSGVTDVDGTLMAAAYQWFANGVAIAGATAATFTPGDAEVGAAISVKVTVVDAQGGSGVVASAPTDPVANVPDAPIAADDIGAGFTTDEATAFTTASVLANDSDPDGDPVTLTGFDTTGTIGLVTYNDDGTFSYDPNGQFEHVAAGESATDSFTYTVSDGNGGTDTATVSITINGVNDAPRAIDDSFGSNSDYDAFVVGTGEVYLGVNNGDGTFIVNSLAQDTVVREGAAFGDLNGDGNLDVFVAGAGRERVWINDGQGNLTEVINVTPTNDASNFDVELGDIDGDGDLDAVVASGPFTPTQIWLNDGSGTNFTAGANLAYASKPVTFDVAVADIDRDGDMDIIEANNGVNRVWLNQGGGVFSTANVINFGTAAENSRDVAVADLDNDGDLDIFVANEDSANTVWLNNGDSINPAFTQVASLGNGESRAVALGDLNGDGTIDAFVANSGTGGGNPDNDGAPNEVWFNDGQGNFTLSTNNGVPLGNNTSLDVELADFDGDGDLDALVANNGIGQPNLIWYNDGDGNFTSDGTAIGTFAARDVALGDIDGDAALASNQVHVLDVLANDADPDTNDVLTIISIDAGALAGALTIAADGRSIEFDPDAATAVQALAVDALGTFTFEYTVSDGHGSTDTASVEVTVRAVNGAPVTDPGDPTVPTLPGDPTVPTDPGIPPIADPGVPTVPTVPTLPTDPTLPPDPGLPLPPVASPTVPTVPTLPTDPGNPIPPIASPAEPPSLPGNPGSTAVGAAPGEGAAVAVASTAAMTFASTGTEAAGADPSASAPVAEPMAIATPVLEATADPAPAPTGLDAAGFRAEPDGLHFLPGALDAVAAPDLGQRLDAGLASLLRDAIERIEADHPGSEHLVSSLQSVVDRLDEPDHAVLGWLHDHQGGGAPAPDDLLFS